MNGKVVVVVGASSGMGYAVAKTFSEAAAKVVIAARNEKALESLALELGGEHLVCVTDATDVASVENLISSTLERFGRIDILVYATGTNIPDRSMEELTYETWEMMMATNTSGAFNCTKALLACMKEQEEGLIIYISSIAAKSADASGVSYQASKHALSGLAHGIHIEQQHNGIRTTIIFPGLTDTPLVKKRPVPTPEDVLAKALQPQDVADACLYVATAPSRVRISELVIEGAEL
ncbi:MAG: hypothetical protein CMI18_13910 [Opitutaceae bacterium]|nr:hypothetical protein [Opitutaceae bacterium]